jgi:hypothetical protein
MKVLRIQNTSWKMCLRQNHLKCVICLFIRLPLCMTVDLPVHLSVCSSVSLSRRQSRTYFLIAAPDWWLPGFMALSH